MFRVPDGKAKLSGSDYEFREPTPRRKQTERSLNLQKQQMTLKPRADQNFIHSHHNEPRVQLFVPKEETFPILLKYIDVTRATHTDEDVMQEKRTEYWCEIDSNRSLSVSWKGFTKFTLLKRKLPKGHMWCGRRLTKVQTTSRQDHVWPEVWTNIGKALGIDRKKNGKTRSQNSTMLED